MATSYIVWDRKAKAAIPGTFASSADATQHANSLAALDNRQDKEKPKTTYDVVTVTT
jgi:hypothetical protein